MKRAWPLLALVSCVGGLGNRPLERGRIVGALVGPEAQGPLVFVYGNPSLQAHADDAGHFTLDGVPVGDDAIIAVGSTTAAQARIHVAPGAQADAGALGLQPAGRVELKVSLDGQPFPAAKATLLQTPLAAQTDGDGEAHLGPLPPGCYQVQVEGVTNQPPRAAQACLAGDGDVEVEIDFGSAPPPEDARARDAGSVDAGAADAGAADAGQDGGENGGTVDAGLCAAASCGVLHCDPADGQCYECVTSTDCGAGRYCAGHACRTTLPPCAPCQGDAECGPGGACIAFAGSTQCAYACQSDADCGASLGYGYQCSSNMCQPRSDRISTCGAPWALGATCQSDADCVNAGLLLGACEADALGGSPTCTVTCSGDGDCPSGQACAQGPDGGQSLCRVASTADAGQ